MRMHPQIPASCTLGSFGCVRCIPVVIFLERVSGSLRCTTSRNGPKLDQWTGRHSGTTNRVPKGSRQWTKRTCHLLGLKLAHENWVQSRVHRSVHSRAPSGSPQVRSFICAVVCNLRTLWGSGSFPCACCSNIRHGHKRKYTLHDDTQGELHFRAH